MISVKIKYKLVDDMDWRVIDVPPEDYFIKDDEPLAVDSVPIYDHAIDYLSDADKAKVWVTQISIEDDTAQSITITETFWNRQRNRIIERIDSGPSPYSEVIVDLQVADEPVEYEIIRLVREQGYLVPMYHGIIGVNPDGSNTERKIELRPARTTTS